MIKGLYTIFLFLFPMALHSVDENPLFKNIWAPIAPIEARLSHEKLQLEQVKGQALLLNNKIEEQEELLNDLAKQRKLIQDQLRNAKTEFKNADNALHNAEKLPQQERQAENDKVKHAQKRAQLRTQSQTLPTKNLDTQEEGNMSKEHQEIIEHAKENMLKAEQKLRNQIQAQNRIDQQLEATQQVRNDLLKEMNRLKKQKSSIADAAYRLEYKDLREARKGASYNRYRIAKDYPELANLYEPKTESSQEKSFWQRLLQKPQSWYRSYAQYVRQQEVEAIQRGESLSKRRRPFTPSFVPRLTELEMTKREQKLAKRLPMQGRSALFESDQTNLNPDKSVAKKAFNEIRTWYSNWKTTNQKTPVSTQHPEPINFN